MLAPVQAIALFGLANAYHFEAKAGDHMTKKQKGRIGPSHDDFLKEEGIYAAVTARAIKRQTQ